MGLLQAWRNHKLRESVRNPNLPDFKAALASGGDLRQEVLDPTGGPDSLTPLLHAMLDWPEDGLGAYRDHWVYGERGEVSPSCPRDMLLFPKVLSMNSPAMERDEQLRPLLTTRAEVFRPFIAEAIARGADLDVKDARGRTARAIAEHHGRQEWLKPQPTPALAP